MTLPYVTKQRRAAWRDEVRTCPDCGEKYYPSERVTKARWDAQETCADPCGLLRAARKMNATRAANKNQMRKGDSI